jgi:hypothetical protein
MLQHRQTPKKRAGNFHAELLGKNTTPAGQNSFAKDAHAAKS